MRAEAGLQASEEAVSVAEDFGMAASGYPLVRPFVNGSADRRGLVQALTRHSAGQFSDSGSVRTEVGHLKAILRRHLHEDRLQMLCDGLPLLGCWAFAAA